LILQTVEAEGFAPQGKREEQDLSRSLLLNLANDQTPIKTVVSAKCGAIKEGVNQNKPSSIFAVLPK